MFKSHNERVVKFANFKSKIIAAKINTNNLVINALKEVIEGSKDYQNYLSKSYMGGSIRIFELNTNNSLFSPGKKCAHKAEDININFEIFYDAINKIIGNSVNDPVIEGLVLTSIFDHKNYYESGMTFDKGMFKYLDLVATPVGNRCVRFEIKIEYESLHDTFIGLLCALPESYSEKDNMSHYSEIIKFIYRFKDYNNLGFSLFWDNFNNPNTIEKFRDYYNTFTDKKLLNKFNELVQLFSE